MSSKPKLNIFFLLLFIAFLFLPLLQLTFEPFPRHSLTGVSIPPGFPKPTRSSFIRGTYQRRLEDAFLKRHGLWGLMVRSANQLSLFLFNQVSLNYGPAALVGRDKQLFQSMYLNSFNRLKVPPPRAVQTRARQIKLLQGLLAQRGIASTLVISSNVPSLYPEIVPAAYRDPSRDTRQNSYEIILPLLDTYGVNYIDGHKLLIELDRQNKYPFRFFTRSASHWNQIAACLVTQQMVSQLSLQLKAKLGEINCYPYKIYPRPRGDDLDLLRVANLLFPESLMEPTPYLRQVQTVNNTHFRPRILLVGTSFSFSLQRKLKRFAITEDATLFFYYRHIRDIEGKSNSLNHANINWQEDIFSYDAIIIESNAAGMGRAGFSFVEHALAQLRDAPRRRSRQRETEEQELNPAEE